MEQKIIEKIVKASGIEPGESVLLHFWGEDTAKATANAFMVSIAALGGSPVLLQEARTLNRDILSVWRRLTQCWMCLPISPLF